MEKSDINIVIEAGAGGSGEAEVRRCLAVLYGTIAGEQALDRNFGLDGDCLSTPTAAAKALYAAEIIEKTATYESRARVLRVEWEDSEEENGQIKPRVVIELV